MTAGTRRAVGGAVAGALLVVAAWGWAENQAVSQSVAALVLAVVSGLFGWRPKWACRGGGYSVVLVIGLPAVVLAAFETADGGLAGAEQLYLPRRMNYADVMIGLYPDRDGYRFLKAQQMGLCRQQALPPSGACRELGPVTLQEIRRELERAIQTGVTSNEDLLRIYVEVLEEEGDTGEVDKARYEWLLHHPNRRPGGVGPE